MILPSNARNGIGNWKGNSISFILGAKVVYNAFAADKVPGGGE
jgi:hypothetical protein